MFHILKNMYLCLIEFSKTFIVCVQKETKCERLNIRSLSDEFAENSHLEIPKILCQTHESELLERSIYCASAQTVNMNLDYEYLFFTANQRRSFLIKEFGADSVQVKAYDMFKDGTSKSDIFRICFLYIRGGVYLDCKGATIQPFRRFIPKDSHFTMFIDTYDTRLSTSFIASTAKNPLIKAIMDEAVNRVLGKYYGANPLDIAGPEMFGKVAREFLKIKTLTPKRFTKESLNVDFIGTTRLFDSFMCGRNNTPLIKRQPDTYFLNFRRLLMRYELSWITRSSYI